MPTREEIVEWLQEAETLAKIWRNECDIRGLPKQANGIDQDAQLFRKRAAQVAAMRCETCAKKITSNPFYHRSGTFLVEHCPWQESGGCFHHEQKPAG
jgi:hypothetical protein